jgi:hypothetical protein
MCLVNGGAHLRFNQPPQEHYPYHYAVENRVTKLCLPLAFPEKGVKGKMNKKADTQYQKLPLDYFTFDNGYTNDSDSE